jgi:hypothetical protein
MIEGQALRRRLRQVTDLITITAISRFCADWPPTGRFSVPAHPAGLMLAYVAVPIDLVSDFIRCWARRRPARPSR